MLHPVHTQVRGAAWVLKECIPLGLFSLDAQCLSVCECVQLYSGHFCLLWPPSVRPSELVNHTPAQFLPPSSKSYEHGHKASLSLSVFALQHFLEFAIMVRLRQTVDCGWIGTFGQMLCCGGPHLPVEQTPNGTHLLFPFPLKRCHQED